MQNVMETKLETYRVPLSTVQCTVQEGEVFVVHDAAECERELKKWIQEILKLMLSEN